MLVNVHVGVRVLLAPLGASGGGSAGGAGPGDSALSAASAPLEAALGLFLAGQLCCGRCTGSAAEPGRGVAALSPGSRANASSSRASRATILSPWALVSLAAGPGHTLRRVGSGGAPVVLAAIESDLGRT